MESLLEAATVRILLTEAPGVALGKVKAPALQTQAACDWNCAVSLASTRRCERGHPQCLSQSERLEGTKVQRFSGMPDQQHRAART